MNGEFDDLQAVQVIEEPTNRDALGYLQSVYNDPLQPTPVRMRAASVAIEYERPRLAVTAVMDTGDFAARLDRAIAKSGLGQAKLIEHQSPKAPTEPIVSPAQMAAPFAKLRRRA
jgi:hypothetical protein